MVVVEALWEGAAAVEVPRDCDVVVVVAAAPLGCEGVPELPVPEVGWDVGVGSRVPAPGVVDWAVPSEPVGESPDPELDWLVGTVELLSSPLLAEDDDDVEGLPGSVEESFPGCDLDALTEAGAMAPLASEPSDTALGTGWST